MITISLDWIPLPPISHFGTGFSISGCRFWWDKKQQNSVHGFIVKVEEA
jgi:hypothetical protein